MWLSTIMLKYVYNLEHAKKCSVKSGTYLARKENVSEVIGSSIIPLPIILDLLTYFSAHSSIGFYVWHRERYHTK